jgi:hypothetical protein
MQRAPYVLGERADSSRKGDIDPCGSHTYTSWRMYGWRMSFYSLSRALGTHGRRRMLTHRYVHVDPDSRLANQGSVHATMATFIVPLLASKLAWLCPPSAPFRCLFSVVRSLGGSYGAATSCAERTFVILREFSIASAVDGFAELVLLPCGALSHRSTFFVICWRSARRSLLIS